MNELRHLPAIDGEMLARVVPGPGAATKADVESWNVTPIHAGGGEAFGVYRVDGTMGGPDGDIPWSVILKILPPVSHSDATSWNFAQREYHAYGSGLLEATEPVAMPRCLGRMLRPDGTAWLWLENIVDHEVWPLSRYRLAAYHLGIFNGRFAGAGADPSKFWLSRRWLRGWLEESGSAVAQLGLLQNEPVIKAVYQDADAILRFWNEREQRLELLESLPQTLCHLDVHRRNMFSKGRDANQQTVLIDWAFVGTAAVGEDLATLVSATIAFGDVPVGQIRELESTVLDGYLQGLRDAGCRIGSDQVWAAYSLSASLRLPVGAVRLVLPLLLEPGRHVRQEQQHDKPLAELFARWSAMNTHLIELGNATDL